MRFLVTCCMAVTLVPGSTSPSCTAISSTGQSLQSAATCTSVTLPGLPSSAWAAPSSVTSSSSSWEPVGRSTPVDP